MSIFSLALRNLRRMPIRTTAIFLGMAAISATLFSVTVIYLSVSGSLQKGRERLGADAMAVPAEFKGETEGILLAGTPSEFYMKEALKEGLKSAEGVKAVSAQLFIVSAPLACCAVSDTMLIGFEPAADFTVTPWLREKLGRALRDDEIIVGSDILSEPGGRIKFYGSEFIIAGKLEPTGMRFIDSSAFIPMSGARKMIAESGSKAERALDIAPDEISAILLRFDEDARPEEAALKIEYSVPEVKVVLSGDILMEARRNLGVPLKAVIAAGALQWAVSLFMIGTLYGLSIGERTREIGLLRAMGAKRKDIRGLFLYEALALSGAGGLAGAIGGALFIFGFHNLIRVFLNVPLLLPDIVSIGAVGIGAAVFSAVSGVLVVIYPSFRVSEKSAHEAIAH